MAESTGNASTKAKNKYNAKAYDRIALQVKKGKRDIIREYAASKGELFFYSIPKGNKKVNVVFTTKIKVKKDIPLLTSFSNPPIIEKNSKYYILERKISYGKSNLFSVSG